MLKAIVRFFNLIHIGMVYLAKSMIVAMVLITFTNVVLRYGFNSGLIWVEEIALLLAVWFIFIAMALGVKQSLHINISLFDVAKMPRWLDSGLHRLRDLVVIAVGIVMLRYGWELVGYTMKSIMPATKWPAGLLYAVLPVSAVIILYESVMKMLGIDTNDSSVDAFLSGKGSLSDALGRKK
ncbi:MAG: TRAP transporter small permease [Treponemataceae bacterium]